jgi:WD40 repeat protein
MKFFKLLNIFISIFILIASCSPTEPYRKVEILKEHYEKNQDIQPLIKAMNDNDLRVRVAAAEVLGEINDPRSIEALKNAVNDRSSYVREAARLALNNLGQTTTTPNEQNQSTLTKDEYIQATEKNVNVFTRRYFSYPRKKESATSLDFSSNGRFLASGFSQGGVVIWDIKEGFLFQKNDLGIPKNSRFGLKAPSTSITFSLDGEYLCLGQGPSISLWNISGDQIWQQPNAHSYDGFGDIGTFVKFSPTGSTIASGSRDGSLKLWDANNGNLIRIFQKNGEIQKASAFSADGRFLATGDIKGVVKIWDTTSETPPKKMKSERKVVNAIVFSPDGKFLVSAGSDGDIKFWGVDGGKLLKTFKGHNNIINSLAFSFDGHLLASGSDDRSIKIWDVENGLSIKSLEGHENWIESVAFSPNGLAIASGSRDGTSRLWDTSTGREIVRLINIGFLDWIIITPDGYFNTSSDSLEHINLQIGDYEYSLDQVFHHFYKPELIQKSLRGDFSRDETPKIDEIATPPKVHIAYPKPGQIFYQNIIDVVVAVDDMSGGLSDILLYHNGKAVADKDLRGIKVVEKSVSVKKQFRVSLSAGENKLSAIALSKDGTRSNPNEVIVHYDAPLKEANLHLLLIGINNYQNPALNLNYAVPDAEGINDFFRRKSRGIFKKVEVSKLFDEQATAETIASGFRKLSSTPSKDVVIIYLAGHGVALKNQWYFITHDITHPELNEQVETKGISSYDLSRYVNSIGARKVLLIIDSCKSGEALLAFRSSEERRALMQLARSTGVYIIAASNRNQNAAEVKELGHGIFTYTLLSGLNGRASIGEQKSITVKRLLAFVEEELPELSQKYKQEPQYPVVYSHGMDFPLVLY